VTLFLGVDGGGTKTAAAVVDADGRILATARGGPSTIKSLGLPAAARVLAATARAAITTATAAGAGTAPAGRAATTSAVPAGDPGAPAGSRGAPVAGAGQRPAMFQGGPVGNTDVAYSILGVADIDVRADQLALTEAFGVEAAPGLRFAICNDSVIALASGTNGTDRGIACIAGTGSVAFGLDGRGGEARVGGWGPPFADAGSAYWIGFQGVARALRLHDEGSPDAPLIQHLLRASGCGTLGELLYAHFEGIARDRLPPLAIAVEAAALEGDPTASAIFQQAGAELAWHVRILAHRFALDAPFPVVLVGGVWQSRVPALRDSFDVALPPTATVTHASVEPAVGAALLARRLHASNRPCPSGLLDDT